MTDGDAAGILLKAELASKGVWSETDVAAHSETEGDAEQAAQQRERRRLDRVVRTPEHVAESDSLVFDDGEPTTGMKVTAGGDGVTDDALSELDQPALTDSDEEQPANQGRGVSEVDITTARQKAGLTGDFGVGLTRLPDNADPTTDEKSFQDVTTEEEAAGGRISDAVRGVGAAVGKGVQGIAQTPGFAAELLKGAAEGVVLTAGGTVRKAHDAGWAIHDYVRPATEVTYDEFGSMRGRTHNPNNIPSWERTYYAGKKVAPAIPFTLNPDNPAIASSGLYQADGSTVVDEAKDFEVPGGSPYVAPDPEYVTVNPAELLPGQDLAKATEDGTVDGWRDYLAAGMLVADFIPGAAFAKGGKVARQIGRAARGDVLESATDMAYVPRLIAHGDDAAAHAASLKLRDQAFRTGTGSAEYGGQVLKVDQKPLDRIIREAIPT